MRVLFAKAIAVFAVMFFVSLRMSGLLLVDYPDYIENKRYQIGLLSKLVNYDIVQPLEARITIIGERGCRQEWDALKRESSDFSDFIAVMCTMLFCMAIVKHAWVTRNRPFVRIDYCRHLKGRRFASGIFCCCAIAVYLSVYALMSAISRRLLAFLLWPELLRTTRVDTPTDYRQLLSAWDQLLICGRWLNNCYCVFGLFAVLVVVVWLFANVRYVKATPAHTPCP